MKIKTSALTGRALDWAVARATGMNIYMTNQHDNEYEWIGNGRVMAAAFEKPIITVGLCNDVHIEFKGESKPYSPSTDWSQCGQLIDKYIDDLTHMAFRGDHWAANCRAVRVGDFSIFKTQTGDTPQIAICRAVVAAQLGDEVEIPDELVEGA
ncbi:phage protein NinX family protein, partial [Xenorhabdus entomophaga]|uniref:phage protein NinX family protein n=1 Tax=Xenorhabdus entomophaga TaxID=3136257 RepID=UPI0030F40BFF